MVFLLRRVLLILLVLSLPAQGWAAARMAAAQMAAAQIAAVQMADSKMASPQLPSAQTGVDEGAAAHADVDPTSPHGCCPSDTVQHGEHGEHGDHREHGQCQGTCADTCHCCISAAPPAVLVELKALLPMGLWVQPAPAPFAPGPAYETDKPPKGHG